jgi:hypothetical protein
MAYSYEIGPVKPSGESSSLLLRLTRNCKWDSCKFCNDFRGNKFEIRNVSDVINDIDTARLMRDKIMNIAVMSGSTMDTQKVISMVLKDPPNESFRNVALWLLAGGENVYLQDSDILAMKTKDIISVLTHLKFTFPSIKSITAPARSQSAVKRKASDFISLQQAGLTDIEIRMGSGYDPVLEFMQKGETSYQQIQAGHKIKDAGINLTEYVMLGLGGKNNLSNHAVGTAQTLNEIDPDTIKIRTLVINNTFPLQADIINGDFFRATDEEMIYEERQLIENLNVYSNFQSNHVSNLLPEVEGKLPQDKNRLLLIIDTFLNMPLKYRNNFMVGRRVGLYKNLTDIEDRQRYDLVEQIKDKLNQGAKTFDQNLIFTLMEDFA